eukprot:NODE_89_length_21781_cov_0.895836.p9 type:complete len:308 gc:universal NODE_89_length_21781_cov_0.895836:5884-6807(+)
MLILYLLIAISVKSLAIVSKSLFIGANALQSGSFSSSRISSASTSMRIRDTSHVDIPHSDAFILPIEGRKLSSRKRRKLEAQGINPFDESTFNNRLSDAEIELARDLELIKEIQQYTRNIVFNNWNRVRNQIFNLYANSDGYIEDVYTGKLHLITNSLSIEHIVPKSVVIRDSEISNDLHNLIPVNAHLNERRKNWPFAEPSKRFKWTGNQESCVVNEEMYVRTEIRGMISRAVIYVLVVYGDRLLANRIKGNEVGDLNMFVRWCKDYKVSELEKWRNDEIEKIQGNRNVFVDHPELCDLVLRLYNV